MKRAEEMRELFARWEESGLSLRAFGKREEVAYTTLVYWRRKFRDEVAEKEPHAEHSSSAGWAPVRVIPDASPVALEPQRFEVWLPNGVALDVRAGFDENELRRLVAVLSTC